MCLINRLIKYIIALCFTPMFYAYVVPRNTFFIFVSLVLKNSKG